MSIPCFQLNPWNWNYTGVSIRQHTEDLQKVQVYKCNSKQVIHNNKTLDCYKKLSLFVVVVVVHRVRSLSTVEIKTLHCTPLPIKITVGFFVFHVSNSLADRSVADAVAVPGTGSRDRSNRGGAFHASPFVHCPTHHIGAKENLASHHERRVLLMQDLHPHYR